jgi:hypothetical protein
MPSAVGRAAIAGVRPAREADGRITTLRSSLAALGRRVLAHDLPYQGPHFVSAALSRGELGSMPADMSCPMLPLQPSGRFANPCLRMHAANGGATRDIRIQRGADHPRRRRRMPADLPPRCAGPRESLINKILCRVLITDAHQNRAEALIPGSAVELREVRPLGSHT